MPAPHFPGDVGLDNLTYDKFDFLPPPVAADVLGAGLLTPDPHEPSFLAGGGQDADILVNNDHGFVAGAGRGTKYGRNPLKPKSLANAKGLGVLPTEARARQIEPGVLSIRTQFPLKDIYSLVKPKLDLIDSGLQERRWTFDALKREQEEMMNPRPRKANVAVDASAKLKLFFQEAEDKGEKAQEDAAKIAGEEGVRTRPNSYTTVSHFKTACTVHTWSF